MFFFLFALSGKNGMNLICCWLDLVNRHVFQSALSARRVLTARYAQRGAEGLGENLRRKLTKNPPKRRKRWLKWRLPWLVLRKKLKGYYFENPALLVVVLVVYGLWRDMFSWRREHAHFSSTASDVSDLAHTRFRSKARYILIPRGCDLFGQHQESRPLARPLFFEVVHCSRFLLHKLFVLPAKQIEADQGS